MNHLRLSLWLSGVLSFVTAAAFAGEDDYALRYTAVFDADAHVVHASIQVQQSKSALDLIDFAAPAPRFDDFSADGKFKRSGGRVRWTPPRTGGALRYTVKVDHLRGKAFDARFTDDWALLRLDDVFPSARTRSNRSAGVTAELRFEGPQGWAFESRYGKWLGTPLVLPDVADTRYPRPTGWMLAGKVGIRRDEIAGRQVAIASPLNHGMRRMDTLSYLSWTLPTLVRLFPGMPDNLLIVAAGKGQWRGGLSGPGSLYLHVDRPLISENSTSPILHELVHVASRSRMASGEDWLVEGLAEYYSIKLLRLAGGISQERFEKALAWQKDWADREGGKLASPSRGPDTARAVTKLADLDRRLPGGLDGWLVSEGRDGTLDCASLARYAKRKDTLFWGCAL